MLETKVQHSLDCRFGGGLVAVRRIQRGEVIAEFDGEFFPWNATVAEIPNDQPRRLRDHCIQCGPGLSRDSLGLARWANHSCEPNCGIRDLYKIVAMRDLAAGEEVTWDYDMSEDSDWIMACRCGAPTCRRFIGGYRHLPPQKRLEYAGFISEWLLSPPRPYVGPVPRPMLVPLPVPVAAIHGAIMAG